MKKDLFPLAKKRPGRVPVSGVLLLVPVLLLGCAGEPDLSAVAPASIGTIQRVTHVTDPGGMTDLCGFPLQALGESSWMAAYGEPDRIRMTVVATQFADPAAAAAGLQRLQGILTAGHGSFGKATPQTVAQQQGFRTGSGEAVAFFFLKGRWILWIEGMVRDFDPTVNSIVWTPAG